MIKLSDGRVFLHSRNERQLFARVALRIGRSRNTFLMSAPDNHGHLAAVCSRKQAGRLARDVEDSLQKLLSPGVPFGPAFVRPIESQSHLRRLVPYILGNHDRHGVTVDPLKESSNLLDLLGLRIIGSYTLTVLRRLLPRLRPTDLLTHLGLESLEPGTDLRHLHVAAASAVGESSLGRRTPNICLARIAAVHVARHLGATTRQIASLLPLSQRSIRELTHMHVDPALVSAIRFQLGARETLGLPPTAR